MSNFSPLAFLMASGFSSGEIIYSNLQNITIPTTYDGIYIDVDGVSGWDFHPYLGGVYVANNTAFQPGRTTANDDMGTLKLFAVDSTIGSGLLLGTGMGGSIDHLGNTFTASAEGYFGFKLGSNYGWMRVIFTDNTSGAKIIDWAYDNTGTAIVTGNVLQSAAVNSAQTVTLNSAFGSFTLGSMITNTNGNTNSVLKTGVGTATLSGVNTYSGATLISGGALKLSASGTIDDTSEVSLDTSGTFDVADKVGGYSVDKLTGSGFVVGNLSVSNQLAIGNSVGTVNFSGNLTLGSESTCVYELTSGETVGLNSADLGDVTGDLTITEGSILDLVQLGAYTLNKKFTLFAYDGTLSGTFKDASSNNLVDGATFTDAGGVWMIDYNDTSAGANGGVSASNQYVTITAIPEANVAALLGGLGLLVLLRRRR